MRLLLAGLLLLPALARAEGDDALGNLVGMADAAATDKGPDAGDVPKDEPRVDEVARTETSPEPAPESSPERVEPAKPAVTAPAPAPVRKEKVKEKDGDAPAVTVPAPQPPRIWTRVFASLLPSEPRVGSFEIAASTEATRSLPAPSRPVTTASAAGAAQGLIEFVAVATAPTLP